MFQMHKSANSIRDVGRILKGGKSSAARMNAPKKRTKRWTLAVGERMMITMNEMIPGDIFLLHSHPHEEAKYVIRGKLELTTPSRTKILKAGNALIIAGNKPHSARAVGPEPAVYVNVFSPPRNDHPATRKYKNRNHRFWR